MKNSEIIAGEVYTNGKEKVRKVLAINYGLESDKGKRDTLQYEVIHDGSKSNKTACEVGNVSRDYFATWAIEKLNYKNVEPFELKCNCKKIHPFILNEYVNYKDVIYCDCGNTLVVVQVLDK